jgi:hypothetical protein
MVWLFVGSALGKKEPCPVRVSSSRLPVVHLQRRATVLSLLVAVAMLLELAAGTGASTPFCPVHEVDLLQPPEP